MFYPVVAQLKKPIPKVYEIPLGNKNISSIQIAHRTIFIESSSNDHDLVSEYLSILHIEHSIKVVGHITVNFLRTGSTCVRILYTVYNMAPIISILTI